MRQDEHNWTKTEPILSVCQNTPSCKHATEESEEVNKMVRYSDVKCYEVLCNFFDRIWNYVTFPTTNLGFAQHFTLLFNIW